MKTKIFISLLILYFLSACGSPVSPQKSSYTPREHNHTNVIFRIKGTITDSTNNSPVKALVELFFLFGEITSKDTDNEGHYTIDCAKDWDTYYYPVDERYLTLQIVATGYKTKGINSDAINHVRITEEWQIIDVQLEPESGGLR